MYRFTDDISVTKLDNATFTVTSVGTELRRDYTTFLGTNKKFCLCSCNNFKRYRMLCKYFLAIFKSGKANFDDLTKLSLNYPYMILDNQHLTKDPTGMPKNCNTLREIDTTNKIQDNLIDSNENNSDVDSGDEKDPSTDNLSENQLLAPVSIVMKDEKKGEIHIEQKKDQQEKDLGGSNCSDTGSKKRKALKKVGNGKEPAKKKAKEEK